MSHMTANDIVEISVFFFSKQNKRAGIYLNHLSRDSLLVRQLKGLCYGWLVFIIQKKRSCSL